jgi:hypothetical protein
MKLDKGAQLNIWVFNIDEAQTVLPYVVDSSAGFSVVCLKEIV